MSTSFCRYVSRVMLCAFVLIFAVHFTLFQFQAMRALWPSVDQTNMEQTIWNTLQGRFMRSTTYPPTGEVIRDFDDRITDSRLGTRVQPLQLVLLFPYSLWQRPETLVGLMCFVVALGAVPAFRIAQRRLNSPWGGLLGAGIYLLLPAVQTNVAWEIHGTSFIPPLLLASFDALESGKRGWWWLWALLAMGCREDIPFLVGWGMLWLAPAERRREAGVMAGVGLGWSLLNFLVIMPSFSGGVGTPYLARFFPPGTEISLAGMLTSLLQMEYWITQVVHFVTYNVLLALPLLFLYFFDWRALLAMAPLLVLNGFTWFQAARMPFFSHYSAPIVSWALIGALEGVLRLERWLKSHRPNFRWRGLILEALVVAVLAANYLQGYSPWSRGFVWPRPLRDPAVVDAILAEIPPDVPLSAGIHLAPRLAQRETLRFFPDLREAEWMAVDLWFWGDPYGVGEQVWRDVLTDPVWKVVRAEQGIVVLRKGSGPPAAVERAFRHSESNRLSPLSVRFGEAPTLWLSGVEAFPLPMGHLVLCSDWVNDGISVLPVLRTVSGETMILRSYHLLPGLFETRGEFRDCTQLIVPAGRSDAEIELSIVGREAVILDVGSWENRVRSESGALVLDLRRR